MKPGPAVVLLSGGLDSAVCLKAACDNARVVRAITFDYGQRARAREIAASHRICERLNITHQVIELPWLAEITHTALVDRSRTLPRPRPDELQDDAAAQSAEAVWVPNRNGVFVMIAAAIAEGLNAESVVAGFNAEEGATFPDNSPEFVDAVNAVLPLSTLSSVRLVSPTGGLTKTEIVKFGREIAAPLELIWSCYEGGPEHCWRCESCLRLRRALSDSGAWSWWREERRKACDDNAVQRGGAADAHSFC